MAQGNVRFGRWMGMSALALALAACGGGGSDGGTTTGGTTDNGGGSVQPGPVADARNGAYTMVAADAREYTLTLDFDAATYHVAGGTVDQSGTFTQQAGEFFFQPGNGSATASTTRFRLAADTAVGEFQLPGGAVPFIAARKFVSTVAGATGVYNFLGRTTDTTGAAADTTIQQAEITADGKLRSCDDATIFTIAACPATSVTTGTLTVSNGVFTATIPAGQFTFRVADVNGDKLYLRATASTGTTRRFVVGTPATGSFVPGSFVGGTTEPAWGTVTLTSTTFSSTGSSPAGVTTTMSGTVASVNNIPDIRVVNAGASGNFFAARTGQIGIVVAARGNASAPGFVAIGKAQ